MKEDATRPVGDFTLLVVPRRGRMSGPELEKSRLGAAIATPCVKVCVVDGASGLCLGCYRTLEEIGGWSGLGDARRAEVMAELASRRARIDPRLLGPDSTGSPTG